MMVLCVMFGCDSKSDGEGKGLHYFRFPTDSQIRQVWVSKVHRKHYVWSKNHRVCSRHFKADDYERDPKFMADLGYADARPRLKPEAVPSLNIYTQHNQNSCTPSVARGAFLKRRRQDVLQSAIDGYNNSMEEMSNLSVDNETIDVWQDNVVDHNAFQMSKGIQVFPETKVKGVTCAPTTASKLIQASIHTYEYKDVKTVATQTEHITGMCSAECQTVSDKPAVKSSSVQCNISTPSANTSLPVSSLLDEQYSSDSENDSENDDGTDPDYFPEKLNFETDDQQTGVEKPEKETKFLVFKSCLLELFIMCTLCYAPIRKKTLNVKGTLVCVTYTCNNEHTQKWESQPSNCRVPYGNIFSAAAILFSGASFSKISRFFQCLQMAFISQSTYSRLQSCYLIPTIIDFYNEQQEQLLNELVDQNLVLGGDGRCDSPGFCAKYGSYTLMDLERNKILDTQLVQSNEVPNSTHMELEGLKRGIAFLESKGLTIKRVVTDRHSQVKKELKENHPDKQHNFDCYHMSTGIDKKMTAASKRKSGAEIRPWIPSVKAHLYWVASSSGDNGELKRAKWLSVLNHISGKHTGHGDLFPECEHGELTEPRPYLRKGSIPYKLIEPILSSNFLLKDIEKLSPQHQTYGLEVFHNVVLSFAPKHTHFFYRAMVARMYLAVLHYNENSDRGQAKTAEGDARWQPYYPKKSKGEKVVVKPIKEKETYAYVSLLMEAVSNRRDNYSSYSSANADALDQMPENSIPPTLTTSFTPYDKKNLIQCHVSRFADQ